MDQEELQDAAEEIKGMLLLLDDRFEDAHVGGQHESAILLAQADFTIALQFVESNRQLDRIATALENLVSVLPRG